jgi:hypothetical protein
LEELAQEQQPIPHLDLTEAIAFLLDQQQLRHLVEVVEVLDNKQMADKEVQEVQEAEEEITEDGVALEVVVETILMLEVLLDHQVATAELVEEAQHLQDQILDQLQMVGKAKH